MARSTPVIYQQLLAQKNAQSNLSSLNSTSQVSIWNLWLWIVATAQSLFEQLCDLFQANIDTTVANAPVFSAPWYVHALKYFQYSAGNPQVVSQDPITYAISYVNVNAALNIITQAAVETTANRTVNIKVATGNPLGPLDGQNVPGNPPGSQYQALQSYLTAIGIPGTQFNIISVDPDLVHCQCDVYYDASYSGVIQANLLAAYTAFLADIPFDGSFEVSALEAALLAVPGVKDIILINVSVRQYNVAWGSGTPLVSAQTLVNRLWNTYAGYATDETHAGEDFVSGLTLIAQ